MTYQEAIAAAKAVTTYDQANALSKAIEEVEDISDRQYYIVRNIAINAAYAAIVNKKED